MRLTDASVAIRPRNAWEAIDLGVLLARRHRGLLMTSWAAISLPIFALLSLLLWERPSWALLLFWLLKPAFERLPLYILSRALFGEVPSLGGSLRAWPRLLRPQLLASLTWRRFSPTRSFELPVQQLEGLTGEAHRQRLAVLGRRNSGSATWLTVIGMHLELALWLGLVGLLYLLLPQGVSLEWDWEQLIFAEQHDGLWLEHLSNLLYALVLVFWEPIYVACGFSLYLNRRTQLEAWDIELAFRRLRQRLTGAAYALLLGAALLLAQPAPPAWAEAPVAPQGPLAERLLQQPLTSKAAHDAIQQLLDQPPFENRKTVTRWRFGADAGDEAAADQGDAALVRWLEWLLELFNGGYLVQALEILLWATLVSLLVLLIWRYRDWLQTFAGRLGLPQRRPTTAPSVLFGLEVSPESLPEDVAGSVERLWDEHPREALGLLYRALLSRLLHDLRLPLKASHTEGEVLALVAGLAQDELHRFSRTLTTCWQDLAYGHRRPPAEMKTELCAAWRRLFPAELPA